MTTHVLVLCAHNTARKRTRQAISEQMLRLVELPFDRLGDAELERSLKAIAGE